MRADHHDRTPGTECWGMEYRLGLAEAAGPPTGDCVPPVPAPDWALPAAERYARARRGARRYGRAAGAGAAATLVAALVAALLPTADGRHVAAAVATLLGLAALAATVWTIAPLLAARRRADTDCADWVADCQRDQAGAAITDVVTEAASYRHGWCPVAPGADRVDVCGGTPTGRAALLSMVAGSVLEAGGAVTVLDLTCESVAAALVRSAGAAGRRIDLLSLPDHLPSVGLLSDLSAAQIGTVLAEAVHVVDRDPDSGDRAGDAALAGQAAAALRGPVTFRRLAAALHALRDTPGDNVLTAAERANLAATRRVTGDPAAPAAVAVRHRLARLAAAAGELAAAEEHDPGVRPYRDPHAQLRVMQLLAGDPETVDGPQAGTGLLAQMLAGVLLHQVRRQVPAEGPARLLVVAGADGLRRSQLERLEALTVRRGIRLLLAYRRLRPDADPPTGRHATILLRQGSATEAGHAAAMTGDCVLLAPDGFPADTGRLPGPPPLPAPPPHPRRDTPVPSRHPGTRYAPTRDFFRALPETAAVLLDPADTGSPRLLDYRPPDG